jgi:four helix bundle protein
MFLELSHTKLNVYSYANELIIECYALVKLLPFEERFNLVQQIKRAALSVKLNIAEGATRKSLQERRRFFEISRGSLVEIDAAFEVCVKLNYCQIESLQRLSVLLNKIYSMLCKMMG